MRTAVSSTLPLKVKWTKRKSRERERLAFLGALVARRPGTETAVCACLAYHNYNNIWEIGALHTLPTARRQGHAQKVVAAAVHHLQINQLRPRYQFHESNHASQQLAKKLGLIPFLTTTHFACQPIIM